MSNIPGDYRSAREDVLGQLVHTLKQRGDSEVTRNLIEDVYEHVRIRWKGETTPFDMRPVEKFELHMRVNGLRVEWKEDYTRAHVTVEGTADE